MPANPAAGEHEADAPAAVLRPRRRLLLPIAASLGLAVLLYGRSVRLAMRVYGPDILYFAGRLPSPEFVVSVGLNVLVTAALVYAIYAALERREAGSGDKAITLGAVAATVGVGMPFLLPYRIAVAAGGAVFLLAYFAHRGFAALARSVVPRLLASLAMVAAVSFGYPWIVAHTSTRLANPPPAPRLAHADRHSTLLVLLLDEWDQELTFEVRPSRIALPNLDRLVAQSIHATEVRPPTEWTREAVPAMFLGRPVARAVVRNSSTLDLHSPDGTGSVFHERDTFLQRLRERGLNTALIGWFHPYCRLFPTTAVQCLTLECPDASDALRVSHYFSLGGPRLLAPIVSPTRIGYGTFAEHEAVQRQRQAVIGQAMDALVSWLPDRGIDVFYAHLPLPHPPGIPDASNGASPPNYFDNLQLADKVLGRIIGALQAAGRWEECTVLVTGDHGMRNVWRSMPGWTPEEEQVVRGHRRKTVPLVVRLPGGTVPAVFHSPLTSRAVGDLVLQWADGRLRSRESVLATLEAEAARAAGVLRSGAGERPAP